MEINLNSGIRQSRPLTEVIPSIISQDIYTDFQSCRGLESAWDQFAEQFSGDIFLTFDWCRIWWKYYGTNRKLRIYVFRVEDQWIGLMPMFLERVSLGPFSVHRVKMVGSDSAFGHFRPAINPEYMSQVVNALLADLQLFSCDQVILGPIAGLYSHTSQLVECLKRAGKDGFLAPTERKGVQTYYPLAPSYDQWIGRLKSSQRNVIQRDYRNLKKQSVSFHFETSAEVPWEEMFDDFVELHQQDWNEQGNMGHFEDWPMARAFHREMARSQFEKGRLRMMRVRCSDGSRAYSYNYHCGNWYFGLLLSRTLTSPQGVSVSRLLHSETVKFAVFESVSCIDAMRGRYEYKNRLGGECFPVRTIYLNRRGLASRLRVGLFTPAAKLFHLLYYKIYYCRLAVRLPLGWRKGLWKRWIRACGDL